MNLVYVDLSDAAMAEALADCEVGVPKTLTITVTPTVHDESVFAATIDSIEYTEPEEEVTEEVESEPVGEAPYKPKVKKASAIAVEE